MATYSKVRNIPSRQRSALITAVAQGDQIDLTDVLGRPATGLKFTMTNATDVIQYRLNNLLRLTKTSPDAGDEIVLVWSAGSQFSVFSETGSETYTTLDGISISSIEIVSLTLSTGSTIEIVAW